MLPSSADREKVLELVELHYEACNIEQVTMGSMMANNKVCWAEEIFAMYRVTMVVWLQHSIRGQCNN